jgi:hypothetical protein
MSCESADWRDSRIVQVDLVDRVPQILATSCRTLLGRQDRSPAAIDAQRERVGDDQDAGGPCEGDPHVGAGGALGQQ